MKRKIESQKLFLSRRIRVALIQQKALKKQFPEGRFYLGDKGFVFSIPRYHEYHAGPPALVV